MGDNNLAAVEAAFEGRTKQRVFHWYTIPASIAEKTGVTKIGLVELFSGEEIQAARRSKGGMQDIETAYELAKESLRWVDEKRVSTADGSVDAFWGGNTEGLTYLRQLVIGAYSQIHNPKAVDVRDFLASHSTEPL
jgi:hypothetical protein